MLGGAPVGKKLNMLKKISMIYQATTTKRSEFAFGQQYLWMKTIDRV